MEDMWSNSSKQVTRKAWDLIESVTVTEEAWNVTETGNVTVAEAAWRAALDQAATIIMAINTLTLMLGMGSAVYWKDLWMHLRRPVGAAIGMVGQFVLLPAIGFSLCLMFQLRPYEALGVLIVSTSPGGSFSNFFTYWVDGDLALSIMMTTCSSMLALGGMPFNLWLYSHYWLGSQDQESIAVPYGNIMKTLAFITCPVVVGMVVRHYHDRAARIITLVASLMGWVGVLATVVIWLILYWQIFVMASGLIYATAFLLPLIGFLLAFIFAKLTCQNHKVSRTIGFETGSQNMPVALSIILLSFPDPKVKGQLLLFPTLYGVVILLEAVLFITAFQTYKRKCAKGNSDDDFPKFHRASIERATQAEKMLDVRGRAAV